MAKILCIDDDPDILEFCKTTLEARDHEICSALSGYDGYKKAVEFKPELIVLDVMMRETTEGFHTAYKFRRDDALRYTPILMMTSINEKTGMRFDCDTDGEYLPVDAFLEKPVSPKLLLDTAERLLSLAKEQINVGGRIKK
jgi:CheY-like chemotaxis protein